MLNTLWERYRSFSTPMQWLVGIAVIVLLGFFYVDVVLAQGRAWGQDADAMERQLVEDARANRIEKLRIVGNAVAAFGNVDPPRTERDGAEALKAAINEIIVRHGLSSVTLNDRGRSNLSDTVLGRDLTGDRTAARVLVEFKFEAGTDSAFRAIADLESNPAVHGITMLRMTASSRTERVSVTMNLESWVLGAPRGTGTAESRGLL